MAERRYDGAMKAARCVLSMSFFSMGLLAAACADDGGFECTLSWYEGDPDTTDLLASTELAFPDAASADAAVQSCEDEQDNHPDRPAGANGFRCDCRSE